jgi:hypothetical protein
MRRPICRTNLFEEAHKALLRASTSLRHSEGTSECVRLAEVDAKEVLIAEQLSGALVKGHNTVDALSTVQNALGKYT